MSPAEVTRFLPLVRSVATHIARRLPSHVDLDDLVEAGVLGLLNAARQFDDSKGVPFERYAEIRVRGAVIDELRAMDPMSRTARTRFAEVAEATRNLSAELGRAPTSDEIASNLGLKPEQYREMMSRMSPVLVLGFDDFRDFDDDEKRDVLQYLKDPNAVDPFAEATFREAASLLASAIEQLSDRQRQVITFYYHEGMGVKQIAEILGVTEGRVSQIHGAAITKLKTLLKDRLDGTEGVRPTG